MTVLVALLAAIRKAIDVAGTTTTDELQTEAGTTITDEAGNPLLLEGEVGPAAYVATGYVAATYVGTS